MTEARRGASNDSERYRITYILWQQSGRRRSFYSRCLWELGVSEAKCRAIRIPSWRVVIPAEQNPDYGAGILRCGTRTAPISIALESPESRSRTARTSYGRDGIHCRHRDIIVCGQASSIFGACFLHTFAWFKHAGDSLCVAGPSYKEETRLRQ